MAIKSPIEWTNATWNPTVGCSKISPGCKNCYAEAMHEYENRVQAALKKIGGSFRLEIDETAPSHMISHHTIEEVLLPELRRSR